MSALTYACAVEVSPGVAVPLERCSVTDLAAARMLEARKAALYAQVELLLADAAKHDLPVPDGLRERIALWTGDLVELETIRTALLDCLVAQP
jgi:hypothetical protein